MHKLLFKLQLFFERLFNPNVITLFGIIDVNDGEDTQKYYTITETFEDSMEYLVYMYINKHKGHYDAWCELYDLDNEDPNNMVAYFNNIEDEDFNSQYMILPITTTLDSVSVLMRVANHCTPYGCSFESDQEIIAYNYNIENNLDNIKE